MNKRLPCLFCLLAFACGGAFAQTNEGLEFWCGFMEHRDPTNTMVAMITSKYNTSGLISIPLQNWERSFTVAANNVTIITLPSSAENIGSEQIDDKGIRVVSDLPASVYIHQYHAMRSEASVVLPVVSTGQEYYVLSYRGYQDQGEVYPSEFLLVGMEDETDITVTVSADTRSGRVAGETFSIQLDAGETYQVQALQSSGDLTASYLTGNKKFNVFAGCRWTQVPSGCNFRDNLLEQMYPVSTWGKQFVTAPNAGVTYDIYRILAAEDQTEVSVKGPAVSKNYSLDSGDFVEYSLSEGTFISANKPIAVAQYLIGSSCGGYTVGDPSIVLLNSIEQIRDTVTLYSSSFEAITENYINIIFRTADGPSITFDGQPLLGLAPSIQTVGPNDAYSYARLQVQTGAHTIISQGCGVIATAYGYGDVESYAYSGGASFKPINAKKLIPEGGCLNDTIFFDTGLKAPRHSFLWDLGDGTIATGEAFPHIYDALGTYQVTLYLTDNCLNTTDTLRRDLLVTLRQAAAVSGDLALCEGRSIQLSAEDLPGARYEWRGPNAYFSTEQSPLLPFATPSLSGEYVVKGIISGCATFPATARVEVFPTPEPDLGRDTIICPRLDGFELTLTPGVFKQYRWQDNSLRPTFDVEQEGLYRVLVIDEHGCTAADTVLLKEVCPTQYYIPNAFSPNDDGENEYFEVFSLDMVSLHLLVYDRWGNLLFESSERNARWDGTFRGQPMLPGVYVWVAEIEGYRLDGSPFNAVEKGTVTLLR